MIVTDQIKEVRAARWSETARSWGLVPTMGYLHEGHLSLVRRARTENQRVAVTIYVNPTQFAPGEDLAVYPKDLERDLSLLAAEKVDLVFIPGDQQMYPPGFQTSINISQITAKLEGASRPSHFQGVATIVAKLFNIVEPTRAYFGQKDAQQAAVIRRLAQDLNFNLEVIICPIVRESDGLAMSSRNSRLTVRQREAATVLHRALSRAREQILSGENDAEVLHATMVNTIQAEPLARLDYASIADPHSLDELARVDRRALLSLAVFFDEVRLIDNMLLEL